MVKLTGTTTCFLFSLVYTQNRLWTKSDWCSFLISFIRIQNHTYILAFYSALHCILVFFLSIHPFTLVSHFASSLYLLILLIISIYILTSFFLNPNPVTWSLFCLGKHKVFFNWFYIHPKNLRKCDFYFFHQRNIFQQ